MSEESPEVGEPKQPSITLMVAIAGLIVLIFAARVIVVRYILTPEWINANVVPKIESAIGRQVSFDDISLGFRGLSLAGLKVSDDPRFERDELPDFATLDQLVLRLRFIPLLRGQLVIPEIVLRDPLIVVHRNAEGKFNFSSLGESPEELTGDADGETESAGETEGTDPDKEDSGSDAGAMGFTIVAQRVRLQNARVVFVDQAGEAGRFNQVELRRFNLTADGVSIDEPFELSASLELVTAHGEPTALELTAQYEPVARFVGFEVDIGDLDLDQMVQAFSGTRVESKEREAATGDFNIAAKAHVSKLRSSGISLTELSGEAGLIGNSLTVTGVEAQLAGGSVSGRADVELGGDEIAYNATASVIDVGLEGLAPLAAPLGISEMAGRIHMHLRAQGTGLPDPAALAAGKLRKGEQFAVEALTVTDGGFSYLRDADEAQPIVFREITVSAPSLRPDELSKFDLNAQIALPQADPGNLKVDGTLDARSSSLDLHAGLDRLDLDALLTALGSSRLSEEEPDEASADERYRPYKVSLAMDIAAVENKGLVASAVHSRALLDGAHATLQSLGAEAAGGSIEMRGEAQLRGADPMYKGKVKVAQVSAGDFTRPFWDDDWGVLTGVLNFDLEFSGKGTQPVVLRQNLRGRGNVTVETGRFSGSPLMTTLAAFTRVDELADMRLSDSGGDFTIGDGKVATERMILRGADRRVVLAGRASLEGALDLEATLGAAPDKGRPAPLDSTLITTTKAKDGWTELPVTVVGTMDRPLPSFPDRALSAKARALAPEELQRLLGNAETPALGEPSAGEGSEPGLVPGVGSVRSVLQGLGGLLNGAEQP